MIQYKCNDCNLITEFSTCPNCGKRTEVLQSSVYWCFEHSVPLYESFCPHCGNGDHVKRMCSDIRPVFPEERLLIEILMGVPLKYKNDSVWCSGNVYYVNGKRIPFSYSYIRNIDSTQIRKELEQYREQNMNNAFNSYVEGFIAANKRRYDYIVGEATEYVREMADNFDITDMFVSFSGGKDSTVVSDLVTRALSRPDILHIYGDTTLEFPSTEAYVKRFKKEHPGTLVLSAKNKEKDFHQLCEQLGPPSRVMRWCCTIFKTGAIQRKITSLFKNKNRILTFYGIRRNESKTRSKYDRSSDSPKITKQKTVSPIIDWFDFDIWLYILTTGIDFNDAYRLGYSRVGCWCCPNNGEWSGFLSQIYMPEQYQVFRKMLLDFAVRIGKPDPEEYIESGGWKARQGGNGVEYSQTSVLTFEPCALQENTINFELQKPIAKDLYELFRPFGYLNHDMGNARLGEVYVTSKAGKPLLKLQGRVGTNTLKVSVLDKNTARCKSVRAVEDKIKCQITKYQMCMGCLGCESVCKHGAINILIDKESMRSYKVSDEKCVRCGECIGHFQGGCYIRKVLTIKREK